MASGKENAYHVKADTKIPIPKRPLPQLPIHLIKKKDKGTEVRYPLRTLNQCTENQVNKDESKAVQKIDTRHVTTRQENEVLDWQYRVFKDSVKRSDGKPKNKKRVPKSEQNNTVQEYRSISETPTDLNKVVFEGRINRVGTSLAVTPSIQSVEHKGVRNVKRSLKRPHSRELQGLSPAVNEKRKSDEKVKRQLQFTLQSLEGTLDEDYWMKCYTDCVNRDYADSVFGHMLTVERMPIAVPTLQSHMRSCLINWLIKINGENGNPTVIQAACWFFDSILGMGPVPLDKLQLVSTACYWIALKIHGPVVSSSKLVRWSRHAFKKDSLLKAEQTILRKLNFPRQPVVPQDFISYFSWWCVKSQEEVEVASTFICLSGLMVEKAFCEVYPSVIAAAAVRNAVVLLGRGDLLKALQSCPVYQAAEKKTSNMALVTSTLRRAVRTISEPLYDYKAPLKLFGAKSQDIVEKVVRTAALMDGQVQKTEMPLFIRAS